MIFIPSPYGNVSINPDVQVQAIVPNEHGSTIHLQGIGEVLVTLPPEEVSSIYNSYHKANPRCLALDLRFVKDHADTLSGETFTAVQKALTLYNGGFIHNGGMSRGECVDWRTDLIFTSRSDMLNFKFSIETIIVGIIGGLFVYLDMEEFIEEQLNEE